MPPDPEALADIRIDGIDIARMLERMNERIEVLLDRDHALGHTYFLPLRAKRTLADLSDIFRKQVLPLLQEYFFEDWERIRWVLNDHRKTNVAHQFVVRPPDRLRELLGEGNGIPTEARQWRINPRAFEHSESFRGIINVE
jgi:5-methylcytosine-specific restriction protein B